MKRLYIFILKSFLPLFAMTFFIVLFIVLMQFLWKHIDDLVGKGLPFSLIGELFFYAGVSMVPMALPLAILLASLMTYGNFGEKFELTAMKASGISLVHSMRPLIVLITLIAIGAFFFQNYALPPAQVKMWTLLFSMRQKSPEVEIPEGVFYDQIPGYNLLVQKKNPETGMLYDVMIYDVTRGGDNATILLADSGRMAFTGDMRYLYLHLFTGEEFENLREQKALDKNVPFRRETFLDKQILIPFDANFNRMDEGGIRSQYVGKNIIELQHTIDSVTNRIDSTGAIYANDLRRNAFPLLVDRRTGKPTFVHESPVNSSGIEEARGGKANKERTLPSTKRTGISSTNVSVKKEVAKSRSEIKETKSAKESKGEAEMEAEVLMPLDLDSLINSVPFEKRDRLFENALSLSKRHVNESQFKSATVADDKMNIRRHQIELLKKYTLSVACLIFFFIGAPLGAIIRKGGLGTPLVISVLLFLFYYIIDNTGYKMARDGRWEVWIGIWLSTFILAPLGIYVTYKAMNDSAVFNPDSYKELIRKIRGVRLPRSIGRKEVVINEISVPVALERLSKVIDECQKIIEKLQQKVGYKEFWNDKGLSKEIESTGEYLDSTVEYLTDCRDNNVVDKLSDYPWIYDTFLLTPTRPQWLAETLKWFVPLGYILFLISQRKRKAFVKSLDSTIALSQELKGILSDDLG
ncbi:MAG: LptF/LptG family permease [Muribaculaceae bacterium]|nr:LptF/LptG family permease [Muribaculaceae bacterium]